MEHWMQDFPDTIPLELLSIPGTHNSATCHRGLPAIRCQALSPREQLYNGVRFLDVRLQVDRPNDKSSDALSLVHSTFSITILRSKKFKLLHNEILDFLRCNPSEIVIVSLKREGRGNGTDQNLAQKLHDYYINQDCWVTKPGIPTLGEARGKIVLLRRFHLNQHSQRLYSNAIGIDAHVWLDNSPNSCAGDIHVQDFYRVLGKENIETKLKYIHEHCERSNRTSTRVTQHASSPDRGPLFLNFMSASNLWKKSCWPEGLARTINPAITQYLCEMKELNKERVCGIFVIDWIGEKGDWKLVKTIVAMNDKLLVQPDNVSTNCRALRGSLCC